MGLRAVHRMRYGMGREEGYLHNLGFGVWGEAIQHGGFVDIYAVL